ncbi:hypothetical protein TKK_0018057 [Trichogramma kaykai]
MESYEENQKSIIELAFNSAEEVIKTQHIFEEEAQCSNLLIPNHIKAMTEEPIDSMSLPKRRELVMKHSLIKFLKKVWIYNLIILQHMKIKEKAEVDLAMHWIPQLNQYHEIIKAFLIWKKEEKQQGSCSLDLFAKWVCEIGYCMMFGKNQETLTPEFFQKLYGIITSVKKVFVTLS